MDEVNESVVNTSNTADDRDSEVKPTISTELVRRSNFEFRAPLGWALLVAILTPLLFIPGFGAALDIDSPPLRPASTYSIDINLASEAEFLALPEIGPVMARRIVAFRDQHGEFGSISDLQRVPGIGETTLNRLRPMLTHGKLPVNGGS